MFFIGIISNKNEAYITKKINKNIDKCKVINITEANVENLKNIKFDIILISENSILLEKRQEELKKIIKNVKYLLVNADISINIKFLEQYKIKVITYGFNSKATITISSVSNDELLLCVQRNITNIENMKIEQQEIILENKNNVDSLKKIAVLAIILLTKTQNRQKENDKIYQI